MKRDDSPDARQRIMSTGVRFAARLPGARMNARDDATPITPRQAVEQAIRNLGGAEYTTRDAVTTLLGYTDVTTTTGERMIGPMLWPGRWRKSFAFRLCLAIRGVL